MRKSQAGKKANEIILDTVEGETFTLSEELQKGKNVLLVFLRHLG
jgi:peroxiredoxin